MDDILKSALEIVKAQASVRIMTAEEISSMVFTIAAMIRTLCEDSPVEAVKRAISPEKTIKEKSILCLECEKEFKLLTKKHLATHGLDAVSYREKWGFPRATALVCKTLQRERRKKMQAMKLWERRRKNVES